MSAVLPPGQSLPLGGRGYGARIETEVELDGVARDNPRFPIEVRRRKLVACQEQRGLDACGGCPQETHCELRAAHVHDVRVLLPEIAAAEAKAGKAAAEQNPWLRML